MKNPHHPIDMNRLYADAEKIIKEGNIFKLAPLLSICDIKTKTRLYINALYRGKKQIVWRIVRCGIPFNIILKSSGKTKFDISTPYIDAIRRGYFDIAEFMHKNGAKIPWQEMLKLNDVVIYESLMESDNDWINTLTNDLELLNSTPIEIRKKWFKNSIQDDCHTMFSLLIDTGISPNEFIDKNETPFQMAIRLGAFKVARTLLNKLPNLKIKTEDGKNLLHILCVSEQSELVAFYKKNSRLHFYKSKAQERTSATDNVFFRSDVVPDAPLAQYVTNDLHAVIDELLVYDELIYEKDNKGKLPIHYASNRSSLLLEKILQAVPCSNILDSKGRSPLFYISNFKCAKVLFEHNLNANIKDFEGNTAFKYLLNISKHNAVRGIIEAFGSEVIEIDTFKSPKEVENLVINLIQNKVLTPKLFSYISQQLGYKFESYSEMLSHLIPYVIVCHMTEYVGIIRNTNIDLNKEYSNGKYFIFSAIQEMMDAFYYYQYTVGSLLLELYNLGVDISKVNKQGDCILHKIYRDSTERSNLDIVIPHLKPEIFSLQDSFGNTPLNYIIYQYGLFHSADGKSFDLVLAIKQANDVDFKTKEGLTLLHQVSEFSKDHSEVMVHTIMQFLIKNGNDINSKDINSLTPLHYACRIGSYQSFKILLSMGADINVLDAEGKNLLFYAASENLDECCLILEDLIFLGIDIGQKNAMGAMPLDYFLGGKFNSYASLEKQNVISKLLPVEYDINSQNNSFGMTPLMRAIKYCANNHVHEVLDLNPDIYLKDDFGLDAIAYSALYNRFEILKTLVEMGASLSQCYPNGETLLHFAVAFESSFVGLYDKSMITYLINNGLSPEVVNDESLSPIAFSVICNNKDYVKHFYSLGFDVNPVISVKSKVHDRGVLSNEYNIYCGKSIYIQKRRICADNLLSYSAVNNCLDGLKGIGEQSLDDKIDSIDKFGSADDKPVKIQEPISVWSAAQHAAYWGQIEAMHQVEKMCERRAYEAHESPECIYRYFLRYS